MYWQYKERSPKVSPYGAYGSGSNLARAFGPTVGNCIHRPRPLALAGRTALLP